MKRLTKGAKGREQRLLYLRYSSGSVTNLRCLHTPEVEDIYLAHMRGDGQNQLSAQTEERHIEARQGVRGK
jgi:hypothetical protein